MIFLSHTPFSYELVPISNIFSALEGLSHALLSLEISEQTLTQNIPESSLISFCITDFKLLYHIRLGQNRRPNLTGHDLSS